MFWRWYGGLREKQWIMVDDLEGEIKLNMKSYILNEISNNLFSRSSFFRGLACKKLCIMLTLFDCFLSKDKEILLETRHSSIRVLFK